MNDCEGNLFGLRRKVTPEHLALSDASTTEPEARQVWSEISERRAKNMRKFAQELDTAGGIRAGLNIAHAADTIWVTNSAEVYVLLTGERGWSPVRYERWLADSWSRILLPHN